MHAPTLPLIPALQLQAWLQEALGRGDLMAPALQGRSTRAHWLIKADGVFCGVVVLAPLLQLLDPPRRCGFWWMRGQPVGAGQLLLELEGAAPALVALERTALNLAMRLIGLATATAELVAQLSGSGVHLADKRKITPGLRVPRQMPCVAVAT